MVAAFGGPGDQPAGGDFDGDGKADLTTFNAGTWNSMLSGDGNKMVTRGIWRDSNGSWYIWLSVANSQQVVPLGTSGDIPTPDDYDGDGKDDFAIYRGAGQWWINNSGSGSTSVANFGLSSDTPIPSRASP